jgi:UDP-N-acetylglucosamine--N-acetylmuramyl-(pentapeptide) pyrophosphoryl-undecaprenol N-acetylglucosamine transferase
MSAKRFIIAGGGTGGHIFPAIAIANAIKKMLPDARFLFVGAKGKMEMEKVPQAGFEIEGLTIAGFNRSSLIKNISLPLKLLQSFFQVARIFSNFKPDAVIGVGGYSSFPVLRYAQMKKIPTFIHEANSYAGKSNMLLAKKALKVFTASAGMEKFFPATKIVVSGNPVRTAIAQMNVDRNESLDFFGLNTDKKTVLVIGGSLGARSINEAIEKNLDCFRANGLQLIWQTGKLFHERARVAASSNPNVYVNDFIMHMDKAYAASDIVISRSGAMSVAELCIVGKPVIFVPFPYAAEDHQTANAMQLVNHEAALMVKDDEAGSKLVNMLVELAGNEEGQIKMKKNINRFSVNNADEIVASEILNSIHAK